LGAAEANANEVLEQADRQRAALLLEAKEEALRVRTDSEGELRERRGEVQRQEHRVQNLEEAVERRSDAQEKRETRLSAQVQEVEAAQLEIEELKQQEVRELERVAGLTLNEARDNVLRKAENEMQHTLARRYYDLEQVHKEEAEGKARKYITLALERLAADVVTETTVTKVPLPNDEMKGRLIGREGRNIRAIELATGVDLIIDDTPEAVTISCFDPIRREAARLALQSLIQDGRIHPARIEEAVAKANQEVEQSIKEAGEQAIFASGVRGIHPELVKLLGRLKFRTSYGGNVLRHSVETSLIAGMLAAECGADVEISKTAALLHDIGKAMTHEVEGPHAEIGGDMAARYGISDPVRLAIMEHHDEEKGSPEAFVVVAADAITSARPGARKDTLERYTKRLQDLEEVARSFPGVDKTYAIQAGREVRIMVKPDQIDDVAASNLANDIVKKIQEKLTYPGQIKVVVIRETRSVEVAR
jgi:ribonuclease Y